LLEANRSK